MGCVVTDAFRPVSLSGSQRKAPARGTGAKLANRPNVGAKPHAVYSGRMLSGSQQKGGRRSRPSSPTHGRVCCGATTAAATVYMIRRATARTVPPAVHAAQRPQGQLPADAATVLFGPSSSTHGYLALRASCRRALAVRFGSEFAGHGPRAQIAARCDFFALARGSKIVVSRGECQLIPRGDFDETNFSPRWRDGLGSNPDGHLSGGESAIRIDCCRGRTGARGRFGAAASTSARRGTSRQGESAIHWEGQRQRTPAAGGDQRLSGLDFWLKGFGLAHRWAPQATGDAGPITPPPTGWGDLSYQSPEKRSIGPGGPCSGNRST